MPARRYITVDQLRNAIAIVTNGTMLATTRSWKQTRFDRRLKFIGGVTSG
jgi:hypothetical protein